MAFALAVGFSLTVLSGCGVKAVAYDEYGYFGSLTRVVTYEELGEDKTKIKNVLNDVDGAISLSVEGSDVRAFNDAQPGETIEISRVGYEIFTLAMQAYALTDGAYNPAVGLLVDLWGFSPRFNDSDYAPVKPYDRERQSVPNAKYIEAFKKEEVTDFGEVKLLKEDSKYYVTKPNTSVEVDGVTYSMQIDLGGIGKGYAADKCAEIVDKRENYYVSVGASSLVLGANAKTPDGAPNEGSWKVTLASPRGESSYMSVFAKNVSASTSGDYERYFVQDGKRYSHIIDPSTGYPIDNGVATVSLFGATSAEGDTLTTALMVMGRNKAIDFIRNNLTGCKVAIATYEGEAGKVYTNMSDSDFELSSSFEIEKF